MIEKLNERITIEKSTVVTDKVGNHRNTWEEYFTCFAYASTYQAQEEEGEVTAEQKSVVFTVRWCSETRNLTSTGYRIRFRDQLYNIESVDPMNYQKKILKIHCRLERRQPDEQHRQPKRSKTRFLPMHRPERVHTKEAGWRPNSPNPARAFRWWCIPRTATSWHICWKKVMPSAAADGWQEDPISLRQSRPVSSSSSLSSKRH